MTVLTAHLEARPGREADLETALRELVSEVAREPGVLDYRLHRHRDAPQRFSFYERYASPDHFDTHMATPHLQHLLARVPELCAVPPELVFLEPLAAVNRA